MEQDERMIMGLLDDVELNDVWGFAGVYLMSMKIVMFKPPELREKYGIDIMQMNLNTTKKLMQNFYVKWHG